MKMTADLARQPEASISGASGSWAATQGAYRLLNNPRVAVESLMEGPVGATLERSTDESVVLCVMDHSELKPLKGLTPTRLWQHGALAVSDATGEVLGLLAMRWVDDAVDRGGRAARRDRWRRSQLWSETVGQVARRGPSGRMIAVADAEADDFQTYTACEAHGFGFVIRAQHDRYVEGGTDRLWSHVRASPVRGGLRVSVPARPAVTDPPTRRRPAQPAREAKLTVRFAGVCLDPPRGDGRFDRSLDVHAVLVEEVDPSAGISPVRWLLLTDEPIENLAAALKVVERYCRRWVIEELHKAQKTGCRLEAARLEGRAAFERLAAITAAVAVHMVQLRDMADRCLAPPPQAVGRRRRTPDPRRDDPAELRRRVGPLWVAVVAHLAGVKEPAHLTPRRFYRTIATKGGWLGRKSDGPPGWQTLWKGWVHVALLIEGVRVAESLGTEPRCV